MQIRHSRFQWFSNLKVCYNTIQFTLKRHACAPTLMFLMTVPLDYQEQLQRYSVDLTRAVCALKQSLPNFYREAERVHMLHHINHLLNFTNSRNNVNTNKRKRTINSSKITHHLVSLIMAEDSSEMNNLSAEMYEMIEFAAQI